MPGGPGSREARNGKAKPQVLTGYQVAEHHLHHFNHCIEKGDIGKSFSHLSLALAILPHLKDQYYATYLDILERWSTTVEDTKGFQQAMTIFEVAHNRYPDSPDIDLLLAKILFRHDSTHEAWTYATTAHKAYPHDPYAQEIRASLTNALVERWHLPMLNDYNRNAAFKAAIEGAVTQGHGTVLDIGCGTGLLSLYAKQAGARAVYGCEINKFMCELSGNVLQANQMSNDILILNHHSKDLIVSQHIPERVSLVVSETVDAGLLGEHILDTLQHAWHNLLLPSPESLPGTENSSADVSKSKFGKVIPEGAEVYIALIQCDYVGRQTKLQKPGSLTMIQRPVCVKLSEPYLSEKLNRVPGGFTKLSEWTPITKINFNSLCDIERHLKGDLDEIVEISCTESGIPDAIALAFKLQLDAGHEIDTFPETSNTLWENAIYPISYAKSVEAKDTVKVRFNCDGVIRLSLLEDVGKTDYLKLSTDTLTFLNSEKTVNCFLSSAKQAATHLRNKSKSEIPESFIICDTLPFPVSGLALLAEFPNSRLFVEDESVQEALQELDISASLSEDLEEEIDVLFLWPVTSEGTMKDGLVKKVLTYRLMMAEDGFVFPQSMDLMMSVIESPTLLSMTRVDDANTCGVKVAEVFNIVKTLHHLDLPLDWLPHRCVVPSPLPVLRLSLTTAQTEALGHLQEDPDTKEEQLLVLGGDAVTYSTKLDVSESSTIAGLGCWFVMHGGVPGRSQHSSASPAAPPAASDLSVSTRGVDSPCNQSVLMLDEAMSVARGARIGMKVVWREGAFTGFIEQITE